MAAGTGSFPTKAAIARAVAAAKAAGLDIAGVEISAGVIRLMEARAVSSRTLNDFDRLEAEL